MEQNIGNVRLFLTASHTSLAREMSICTCWLLTSILYKHRSINLASSLRYLSVLHLDSGANKHDSVGTK